MGLGGMIVSRSCCDYKSNDGTQITPLGNPVPSNYTILQNYQNKNYTVLKIKYPDCNNYEGIKILVFNNLLKDIMNQKVIDPHFSDNKKFISPIARFEPTEQGWQDAINFIYLKLGLR